MTTTEVGPHAGPEVSPADVVLGSARGLDDVDALAREAWASLWLGEAWRFGGQDGDAAVVEFLEHIAAALSEQDDDLSAAVLASFRAVAPQTGFALLDAAGASSGPEAPTWRVEAAERYVDPWECERFLVLTVVGPVPHSLLIAVDPSVQGVGFIRLLDVEQARGFFEDWSPELPPMRRDEVTRYDVLSEAVAALRLLDAAWPRNVDDDTAGNRALAWTRCRDVRAAYRPSGMTAAQGLDLAEEFLGASQSDGDVESFCIELILDFGEGYMSDPTAWSPHWVTRFLLDAVPNNRLILEGDRTALPGVLRRWVEFILTRRGLAPQWIAPVVAAVEEHEQDFYRMVAEPEDE